MYTWVCVSWMNVCKYLLKNTYQICLRQHLRSSWPWQFLRPLITFSVLAAPRVTEHVRTCNLHIGMPCNLPVHAGCLHLPLSASLILLWCERSWTQLVSLSARSGGVGEFMYHGKIFTNEVQKLRLKSSRSLKQIVQQSHCWAYTPRKQELKETHVPNVHHSTVYNRQDMEAT